ncbi:hypothetical protein PRIPAC_74220 [Pristionchus pacificus]|uniref:Uncharacterized protein n=1 Tax=Pristionchus pacificus TaxID=54126 RepID=A0A2A6CFE6_PRIPA|nr:hypothetical protein PRIPAC_74220 [Pristionchus pacificus]|eukprot:PDM76808.1 hypothetical protein PRIPAC_42203 [Pristionchus pacificus]
MEWMKAKGGRKKARNEGIRAERMGKKQRGQVKAGAPEANPNEKDHTVEKVVVKDHTEEKVIAKVECESEGFRDHNVPAVIENVIVKVECEAGSARDHNAPEAKVKVRGHETNDSGYTEIFLQDRYSDNVRVAPENTLVGKSTRMEKKAKFKPISERDNPIQCDHLSSEIDVKKEIPSEAVNDNHDGASSVHELVHQTNGEISFFLVLERSSSNCSGQFSSNVDEQVGMVDLEAVHDRHSLLDGNSTDEV